MQGLLGGLVPALRQGRVAESLSLMQDWLATANPGDPTALVRACPVQARPLLTTLIRDVLSGFPAVLFGCPILVYATPEIELDSPVPQCLWMPTPQSGAAQPCAGLQFEGWLPADAELPVNLPPNPFKPTVRVPWRTPTAAVALFRYDPTASDIEVLDVPPAWWGELFLSTAGQIRLSGRMLLPYPDALEAAEAMQRAARGRPQTNAGIFLADGGWANEAGALFAAECARTC